MTLVRPILTFHNAEGNSPILVRMVLAKHAGPTQFKINNGYSRSGESFVVIEARRYDVQCQDSPTCAIRVGLHFAGDGLPTQPKICNLHHETHLSGKLTR